MVREIEKYIILSSKYVSLGEERLSNANAMGTSALDGGNFGEKVCTSRADEWYQ